MCWCAGDLLVVWLRLRVSSLSGQCRRHGHLGSVVCSWRFEPCGRSKLLQPADAVALWILPGSVCCFLRIDFLSLRRLPRACVCDTVSWMRKKSGACRRSGKLLLRSRKQLSWDEDSLKATVCGVTAELVSASRSTGTAEVCPRGKHGCVLGL